MKKNFRKKSAEKFDQKQEDELIKVRLNYFLFAIFILFITIIARLFFLQITEGADNRKKSETNRIRQVRIQPQRGKIYDIKGRMIAGVKYSFDIYLNMENAVDFEKNLPDFLTIINESESNIRTRLSLGKKQPRYLPVLLKRDIDWITLSRLESSLYKFPGIFIDISYTRSYPNGTVAPHLIGYLGEVSEDDLKSNKYQKAKTGDMVGKYGLEEYFNSLLCGEPGEKKLEVNAKGRLISLISKINPSPGNDIYLTIDMDLQKAAEESLLEQVGAIVAIDPKTGNIKAMASSPVFNPALFIRGLNANEWKELNDPKTHPLQNKTIQGVYAPGSTFKPLLAFAGLNEGTITENSSVFCNGSFDFGKRSYRCWKEGGHGHTDFYKSLVESCDVFYYNLGLKLGVDKIAKYANTFGLGEKTRIELSSENEGLIPSSQWKKKKFKVKWYEGETISFSIGQGYTLTTPLQIANFYAAIANNGILYQPNYISKIVSKDGKILEERKNGKIIKKIDIPQKIFTSVTKALSGVVNDDKGTGKNSRLPDILVAGKTGTAQVYSQKKRKETENVPWHLKDHAWFASFAPVNKPEIVVVVLIEHGGGGGANAAPVAKKILERWFQLQKPLPETLPERSA